MLCLAQGQGNAKITNRARFVTLSSNPQMSGAVNNLPRAPLGRGDFATDSNFFCYRMYT